MVPTVAFYLFPQFQLLDLTGPLAVFQMAALVGGTPGYRFRYLSRAGGPVVSSVGISLDTEPAAGGGWDNLLVAGGFGVRQEAQQEESVITLARACGQAIRWGSVCTGAFLLAQAGLLDGRRATTHWRAAADLGRRFPKVLVEPDSIFVHDGPAWTSAGVTAGIDLALVWVEADWGREVARACSQELVVYHRRPGGQSQFSQLQTLDPSSERLRRVVTAVRNRLNHPWTLEALAEVACLSPRQLTRVLKAESGISPAKLVERLRTEAARAEVVEGTQPVEAIAPAFGFQDPERMRRAFLRWYGQPPQALRRQARSSGRS